LLICENFCPGLIQFLDDMVLSAVARHLNSLKLHCLVMDLWLVNLSIKSNRLYLQ